MVGLNVVKDLIIEWVGEENRDAFEVRKLKNGILYLSCEKCTPILLPEDTLIEYLNASLKLNIKKIEIIIPRLANF